MAVRTITPHELFRKMSNQEKLVLVDVRTEDKYNVFHIESSSITNINIPKKEIFQLEDETERNASFLPVDQELIITCTTGNSAAKCATILTDRAYDVVVLEGGITAWKEYISEK